MPPEAGEADVEPTPLCVFIPEFCDLLGFGECVCPTPAERRLLAVGSAGRIRLPCGSTAYPVVPLPACVRICEFCALFGLGELVVVPVAGSRPIRSPLVCVRMSELWALYGFELSVGAAPEAVPERCIVEDSAVEPAAVEPEASWPVGLDVCCAMGDVDQRPTSNAAKRVDFNFMG